MWFDRRDFHFMIFWGAITFLLFYPFALIGPDFFHDSFAFKVAMDVANGQTLFTDTYSQYAPFSTYINVFFLKVFGEKLISLRYGTLILYALSSAVLYVLARLFLTRLLSIISMLIWLSVPAFYLTTWHWYFLSWSSIPALLFQAICILLLCLAFFESPRTQPHTKTWLLFFSGIFASLCLLTRQPVGGFLGLSILSGFILKLVFPGDEKRSETFKSALIFGSGSLSIISTYLIYLTLSGSLPFWWEQNVMFPMRFRAMQAGGWGDLFRYLILYPRQMRFFVVCILGIAAITHLTKNRSWQKQWEFFVSSGLFLIGACFLVFPDLHRRMLEAYASAFPILIALVAAWLFIKRRLGTSLLFFTLTALSSWMQFYPVPDLRHQHWSMGPMIIGFVFFLHMLMGKKTLLTSSIAFLIFWSVALNRAPEAYKKLTTPYTKIERSVLAGFYAETDYKKHVDEVLNTFDEIKTRYGAKPVLVEGYSAYLSTIIGDLRNAGPVYMVYHGLRDTQLDEAGLQFIRAHHPVFILQEESPAKKEAILRELGYVRFKQTFDLERRWGTYDFWVYSEPQDGKKQ